jgi:hypothetical protein
VIKPRNTVCNTGFNLIKIGPSPCDDGRASDIRRLTMLREIALVLVNDLRR